MKNTNITSFQSSVCRVRSDALTTAALRWPASGTAPTASSWSACLPFPSPGRRQRAPSPAGRCHPGRRPCRSSPETRGRRACTPRPPRQSYPRHSAWRCWGSSCRAWGPSPLSAVCSDWRQRWRPPLRKERGRSKYEWHGPKKKHTLLPFMFDSVKASRTQQFPVGAVVTPGVRSLCEITSEPNTFWKTTLSNRANPCCEKKKNNW